MIRATVRETVDALASAMSRSCSAWSGGMRAAMTVDACAAVFTRFPFGRDGKAKRCPLRDAALCSAAPCPGTGAYRVNEVEDVTVHRVFAVWPSALSACSISRR